MEGRPTTLNSQKISRLEAVGMVWDARKRDKRLLMPCKKVNDIDDESDRETVKKSTLGLIVLHSTDDSSSLGQEYHGKRRTVESLIKTSDNFNGTPSSPQASLSILNQSIKTNILDDESKRMKNDSPHLPVHNQDQALLHVNSPTIMFSNQESTVSRSISIKVTIGSALLLIPHTAILTR
jgi:hypothetical protein